MQHLSRLFDRFSPMPLEFRRVWRVLLVASLLAALAPAGLARAGPASSPLILERGFWEDKSAAAPLSHAKSQDLAPFEGHFSRGYSASAHWIRLRLAASATPIGLRVTPPWVDELTLHDELDLDAPQRAGDRHPDGLTVTPTLGYSFVLPASAAPRDIWLRLRTTSSQQLHVQAMPADELHAAETRAIVWVSLYSALLLLILLALLGAWFVQRDPVLGIYLLRHSVYLVYGVSYLGLPFFLLDGLVPASSFHAALSLSITLLLPLGLWFDIALLKAYRPHPMLLRAAQGLCVLSLGLTMLWTLGFERHAVHATVMGLMPAALLVFTMAISTRPPALVEQLMPKRVMLFYYMLILSSLFIGLLGKLGLSQPDTWSQYLLILHGLASGLVMTMILIVRGQRQYRQNQQVAWQLEKSQQEAELERRRHQEQSQFLHMLMHELKTPLSIVSLALGTQGNREENLQHAGRAVRDMKAIIDRCVQADQLGRLSLQPKADEFDLRGVLESFRVKIPNLASRLRVTLPDRLPLLQSDRQLLEIVLINLLDNASRYSDPVTPVMIDARLSRRGERAGLEVCVSNTPGLAGWPDSDRVFGKYYRSSSALSQSGTGLGLFLSRELAQTLGGSLDYAPSERLVRFVLWIPLNPT